MGGVDDELHVHTSPRPRPTVTVPRLEREARTSLARHASTRNASRGQTIVHSQVTGLGTGRSTPYVILRRPGRRVIQVSFISFMEAIQPISDPGYVLGTSDAAMAAPDKCSSQ